MKIQEIKWKNIAIVLTVLAVLGALAYGKFYGYSSLTTNSAETTVTTTESKPSISERVKSAVGYGDSTPAVNVELPPEPVNGVTKGVVEVGSVGFNSFVILTDGKTYKVIYKGFDKSLVRDGLASFEDIKSGLKNYLNNMSNLGVESKNLHFVVSSGAIKEPVMEPIVKALKERGFVVNVVTPEQEASYAYKATMHPYYKDKAFVVDVGGKNTKLAWEENGGLRTSEAAGSKYFMDGTQHSAIFEVIKQKASQIPQNKRQFCFLIGGTPYDLAKQSGNGRYIQLRDLNSYQAGADKKLESGLNILKAIQSATNTQYIFDMDSNFTIGFLMSLK